MTGPPAIGLCGFFGAGSTDGGTALAAMARALGDRAVPGRTPADHVADGAGLHVSPGFSGGGLARDGDVAAMLLGRVQWTEAALAQEAAAGGDARALIAAYRRYGPDLLDHLKGRFCLAVWDGATRHGMLAIDRMGQEGLCWAQPGGDGLAFASRATAVCAFPGLSATVTPQALYNYLYFYVVPAPAVVFAGQSKLLPGQRLVWRDGTVRVDDYWRMPYRTDGDATDPDALGQHLLASLRQAMARAVGDPSAGGLGAFLSGGLDSSAVAGLLAEAAAPARTFTIRFDEPRYDEGHYARIAADHYATEHREYFVTPDDALALMRPLAAAYDEPFGNTSAIPAYYCARLAAETGVSTMLAGDGGDELFAGNERYVGVNRYDVYGRVPAPLRRLVLDPLLSLPVWAGVPVMGRARSLMQRYNMTVPQRLHAFQPITRFAIADLFDPDLVADIDPAGPGQLAEQAYGQSGAGDRLQRMMAMDLRLTLADNDLRKVNRMCDLAGVEVRYPFLDDDVVAFSATLPPDLLLAGGQLRAFYKRSMRGFLPDATIDKQKHGFGAPFLPWIGEHPPLREAVCDLLVALRGRRIMARPFLDRLVAACRGDDPAELRASAWDVAMLELWLSVHDAGV